MPSVYPGNFATTTPELIRMGGPKGCSSSTVRASTPSLATAAV